MVMSDSKLTIEVIDGRGFIGANGQPFRPVVFISCEKQRYELRDAEVMGSEFVWNERVAM